ncbi:MAG: M48 family metalloprotease [Planctomycetota bacterium]
MNYKRSFNICCLITLIAFLTGCQAMEQILKSTGHEKEARMVKTTATAGAALMPFSIDEEVEIGRTMAARLIEASGGLGPDEKLNRYVNLVGRYIALHVSREDLDSSLYQFAVVNTDEINAFAMPGGYILITRGALKNIQNESELAGVLAHEIAHVDKGHMLSAIKTAYGMQFLGQMAEIYNEKNNNKLNQMLSNSSEFGLTTLYQKGLSRESEEEADQEAVKLLAACGYQPDGLKNFLNRIKDQGNQNASFLKTLAATHPNPLERIKTIDDYLARKNLDKTTGQSLTERYQTFYH